MKNGLQVPFTVPDITELEVSEVSAALMSGWITTGQRTKALEKKIADKLGVGFTDGDVPRCVCLNSQTACAELALHLLGVGAGDEVICPAYTYTATASVVIHVGAKLVLVDSAKDTFEMDYDALENAITEKTKVIIPVDIGGVPCDYDRIFEIVERKKALFKPSNDIQRAFGRIIVLADSAHAFGAKYGKKYLGNVADFTAFSFHAVKNFTTGEGGALTWRHRDGIDDKAVYKQLQLFSLHGQNKDAFNKFETGSWEYDIVGIWYKCNMSDIVAAVGLKQLERYGDMLNRRRELIGKYDSEFLPLGIKTLCHYNDKHESSGHLYITRIPGVSETERGEIIKRMADCGISCNVHFKPLPMFTAYKQLGFDIKDYPNAYDFYKNEITLPLYSTLSDERADYVIEQYKEILKEYMK